MNKLEKLAKENKDNYNTYLTRMNDSFSHSTKQLIPLYAKDSKTILDVGCASGTLIETIKEINPEARVIGIDINQEAINIASEKGYEVYNLPLEEVHTLNIKFDCIIFSSVLHEFSSYDKYEPYTKNPIQNALVIAYDLLAIDGKVIIRDGLGCEFTSNDYELIFKNQKDIKWVHRFIREKPFKYQNGNFTFSAKEETNSKNKAGFSFLSKHDTNTVFADLPVIQEFLATYTWGESSWAREINEQFCLMKKWDWEEVLTQARLNIVSFTESREEYPKYLESKVKIKNNLGQECHIPYMTCLIVATKSYCRF